MSDDRAKEVHRVDQQLALQAQASAEIATMYRTLLAELRDRDAALALTQTWIMAIAGGARSKPEEPK